ncbi:MAG: ABC transporter ATP-binding protein [Acidobacteria bacterium]|nr:ABC transporter ATP-binding protein [Acidobacteriota bacterium]MCG3194317.1 putative multidrug export ATP-binding/permease protein [Thermoanaerobaculia bacterium]
MTDFRRLLVLFKPYRRAAIGAILAMAGVAFFTALVAYLFGPLFDVVLTPEQKAKVSVEVGTDPAAAKMLQVFGSSRSERTPVIRFLDESVASILVGMGLSEANKQYLLPLLLFAAFLSKNFFAFLAEYRFNAVGLAFVRGLRSQLYRKLLDQSGTFHARYPSGDLISRVTGDVDRIQNLFGTDLADLVQSIATLLLLMVLVVSRSPELTAVALIVAPAVVVPVLLIAKRLRRLSKAGREQMAGLTGVLSETLRGYRVVQAYRAEDYETSRFDTLNDRAYRLLRRGAGVMALSSPLVETASVSVFLVLLGYAGSRISAGRLTLGEFISFGVGLVMMYQPFKRATRTNLALQQALVSARRVFEALDETIDVQEKQGAPPLAPFRKEIRFDGVSFAYPGRGETLRGVDVTIPKGSVTALAGPSGGGKSTLVSLLPRFMDVTAGSITIDGKDIRDVSLESLRSALGLVTQEVVLFDDSIRRNVAYGRDDHSEEEIWRALKAANAEDFVRALPHGLDTRTGEAGSQLSGGQRQRLAIARAILRNPPILILDEATSALDTESEHLVQEALERLMAGRTTIVIAHRLSTIRRADQILVLSRGEVVERGTHQSLYDAGGLYRRLHDLQDRQEEEP